MRVTLSLRAVAVGWLARREHSERELRRKLLNRLRRDAAAAQARNGLEGGDATDQQVAVDEVIAWLLERGYLDQSRFIESRVHARAARFGTARIEQELSQHGLALEPAAAKALRLSEFDRAVDVWQRRFSGEPPVDARAAARQARFLAARGFAGDIIRRVLRLAGKVSSVDSRGS
jgi:regulatory protein